MAAELVERIDYDFPGHFEKPTAFHVIRARVCDDLIRNHLRGQGSRNRWWSLVMLDTQLWRIGDERLRWVSVDVPESIQVRRALLPPHPHATLVSDSALHPVWMDAVPTNARPFITVAGLLMYFKRENVRQLLMQIAQRFPGAEQSFDTIHHFFHNVPRRESASPSVTSLPPYRGDHD